MNKVNNFKKSIDLLANLFEHISKPSKEWPQTTIGKNIDNEIIWYTGGVDDEFRDYLVRVNTFWITRF